MFSFFRPHRLTISSPRRSTTRAGLHRVEAVVGGSTVFFESTHPLAVGAEAFGTAFLLPAMRHAVPLTIEAAVCPTWLENVQRAQRMMAGWWSLPPVSIDAQEASFDRRDLRWRDHQSAASEPSALFFTGGVDSFHSLLQLHNSLDTLIFVEGFDVPLRDTTRLEKVRQSLAVVVEEKQRPLIAVRTNLRQHRWFRSVGWHMAHGAALAAVGHLVCPTGSTAAIASADVDGPHGTHAQLDQLWSSHRLTFQTHGTATTRLAKAQSIVRDSTVRKTLRVCWRNQSPNDLNCGYCEKCLRTQLQMRLGWTRFPSHQCCFPSRDLLRDLQQLSEFPPYLFRQWYDIADRLTDIRLRDAVERLLDRSPLETQRAAA